MLNKELMKEKACTIIDALSIIYLLGMLLILVTGGYKGEIFGIYISIRRLERLIYAFMILMFFRYMISRQSLIETGPVQLLIRIKDYLLNKPFRTLFIGITLYLIYFKIMQHFTYCTYLFDLSVFDYPIHNTLNGDFMYSTWYSFESFLGVHFWPILVAIVPFYFIFDSPVTLLVLQGIFYSLALIPLLKIADDNGFNREDKLYLALFFMFNFYMWRGFEYNFHIEILYPALILAAFYTAFKEKYLLHTLFILLTLTVKEDAFLHCIMVELYILLTGKNKKLPVLNIILSLAWGIFVLKFALPHLQGGKVTDIFMTRYKHLGSSYSDAIINLLTRPFNTLGMIFRDSLIKFFLSFALIPLFSMKLAVFGIPGLMVHLITNFAPQYELAYYHPLPAIPFFVIAVIFVLKKMNDRWRKRFLVLLVIISFQTFRTDGLLIPSASDIKAHNIFSEFSKDDIISAQANIIPHLPRSENISPFPRRNKKTEYILLRFHHSYMPVEMTILECYREIRKIIDNEGFAVRDYFHPFLILKKDEGVEGDDERTAEFKEELNRMIEKRK